MGGAARGCGGEPRRTELELGVTAVEVVVFMVIVKDRWQRVMVIWWY